MTKETFHVPGISEAIAGAGVPLSAVVKGAGLVFVSGMPPIDTKNRRLVNGDISKQTEVCLDNVKAALEAAGSSMDKVLKVTVFLTDMRDFQAMNEVYRTYFSGDLPARSTVGVSALARPELHVEIEMIAHVLD